MNCRQWGGRQMQRYALRDDQWTKIRDFLPGREGHVGGTAAHKRLRRWCESGVFARILEALAFDADAEYMSIDSTSVRAHQHSAGAQKKTAKIKPSADPAAD